MQSVFSRKFFSQDQIQLSWSKYSFRAKENKNIYFEPNVINHGWIEWNETWIQVALKEKL